LVIHKMRNFLILKVESSKNRIKRAFPELERIESGVELISGGEAAKKKGALDIAKQNPFFKTNSDKRENPWKKPFAKVPSLVRKGG